MRTKSGEEYLSSKDACAVSGFSDAELKSLCLEGRVKSRWLSGGYFIEKTSLLDLLKKKKYLPYGDFDLGRSLDIWHNRVFGKFRIIAVMIGVFFVIFVLPVFFLDNFSISEHNIADTPATFNSVTYVSGGNGMGAAVGYINNIISNAIEKSVTFLFNLVSSIF